MGQSVNQPTVDIEKTVLSALMRDAALRIDLIRNYPGVTVSPEILFATHEAQTLAPAIVAKQGRYTRADQERDLPNVNGSWAYDKIYFLAVDSDIKDFISHCEVLRQNRKHELSKKLLQEGIAEHGKSTPDKADSFAAEMTEKFANVAMTNLSAQVKANADEIDDKLIEELAKGQHQKSLTGVPIIDYLTGGGLELTAGSGQYIAVGGQKKQRKTTMLQSLVYRVLTKYPVKCVWVSTEPSEPVVRIEVAFLALIATDWLKVHENKEYDFSKDDILVARSNPKAFQDEDLNVAVQWAVKTWRDWKDQFRIFTPGIRDGNTLDFANALGTIQVEVEARNAGLVVIDRLTSWLDYKDPNGSMDMIVSKVGAINSRYKIPVFAVVEYTRDNKIYFGRKLEYDTALWLECKYNSKETPDEMEIEIREARHIGADSAKCHILKKSGLLGAVK